MGRIRLFVRIATLLGAKSTVCSLCGSSFFEGENCSMKGSRPIELQKFCLKNFFGRQSLFD